MSLLDKGLRTIRRHVLPTAAALLFNTACGGDKGGGGCEGGTGPSCPPAKTAQVTAFTMTPTPAYEGDSIRVQATGSASDGSLDGLRVDGPSGVVIPQVSGASIDQTIAAPASGTYTAVPVESGATTTNKTFSFTRNAHTATGQWLDQNVAAGTPARYMVKGIDGVSDSVFATIAGNQFKAAGDSAQFTFTPTNAGTYNATPSAKNNEHVATGTTTALTATAAPVTLAIQLRELWSVNPGSDTILTKPVIYFDINGKTDSLKGGAGVYTVPANSSVVIANVRDTQALLHTWYRLNGLGGNQENIVFHPSNTTETVTIGANNYQLVLRGATKSAPFSEPKFYEEQQTNSAEKVKIPEPGTWTLYKDLGSGLVPSCFTGAMPPQVRDTVDAEIARIKAENPQYTFVVDSGLTPPMTGNKPNTRAQVFCWGNNNNTKEETGSAFYIKGALARLSQGTGAAPAEGRSLWQSQRIDGLFEGISYFENGFNLPMSTPHNTFTADLFKNVVFFAGVRAQAKNDPNKLFSTR